MAHLPKKENTPSPQTNWESEEGMAQAEARVLEEQRKQSGGLEDSSNESSAKVVDPKPFKNLKSY
jgi:hypothetical protein